MKLSTITKGIVTVAYLMGSVLPSVLLGDSPPSEVYGECFAMTLPAGATFEVRRQVDFSVTSVSIGSHKVVIYEGNHPEKPAIAQYASEEVCELASRKCRRWHIREGERNSSTFEIDTENSENNFIQISYRDASSEVAEILESFILSLTIHCPKG